MRRRRGGGPIRADGDGFVIDIGPEETQMIRRLLGELRALLSEDAPDSDARLLLVRLFPVVHADDPTPRPNTSGSCARSSSSRSWRRCRWSTMR
jgi:hypothetical protein